MDALRRLHKGILFQSPDGSKEVGHPIDGIVDDTTVGTNTTGEFQTIQEEAQVLAQNWADLLWMSGGVLEHRKCYYYNITWSWNNGRPVISRYNLEIPIKIRRGDSTKWDPIPQHPSSKAVRNLGVRLAPDGNLKDKFGHLLGKANAIPAAFCKLRISFKKWLKAYHTVMIPMLTYALSVPHFTRKEMDYLQGKLLPSVLNAGHFPTCFPRAVASAPTKVGGIELSHLYFIQGFA